MTKREFFELVDQYLSDDDELIFVDIEGLAMHDIEILETSNGEVVIELN